MVLLQQSLKATQFSGNIFLMFSAIFFTCVGNLIFFQSYLEGRKSFGEMCLLQSLQYSVFFVLLLFPKMVLSPKYDFFFGLILVNITSFPNLLLIHATIALSVLIYEYTKNKDNAILKGQIRNTMIAGIMGYTGGISNFFPQFFNVYPYGNYLVILFIVFMVLMIT